MIHSRCPRRFSGALSIGLLFVVLLAATSSIASASWVSLGGAEGSPVDVRVLESGPDRIVLDYTIPGFYAEPVTISGQTYYRISLPGEGLLLQEGLAELPHVARSVLISDRAKMEVHLLDEESQDFPLAVVPSKGNLPRTVDPADVPFRFDPAYGSDRFYPEIEARGGAPYILRDYRGMVVDAMPLRARGIDGTLRAARHMQIEVVATGVDEENVIHRAGPPESIVSDFAQVYEDRFVNWAMDRYTPVVERGKMLIITDDAFHANVAPLAEWKKQSGISTRIVDVSTIGNTWTAIKAYIQSTYDTEGVAFVLLVGDNAQVATPHAGGGASDPTYSLVRGGDNYPDLFVGRLSAGTPAEVDIQVLKTIGYEKTPQIGASWYAKGTGIGSDQGPGDDGEYDYQHIDNIRTNLLNYGYTLVDRIYDPGATAAMVTTALNEGRSIVNYCGHGSQNAWSTTGFSSSNVSALHNEWMLPFIWSVACVNGQFENATCFAETWLRANQAGVPTGAVATYMSSINQTWNPPMAAEDEFVDLLTQDQMHTFGGCSYNGSCKMIDQYGSGGVDMFLTWHIFGDPSLLLRTKTPIAMTAQHSGGMIIGQTDYPVVVPGVANALCALYADGVLYGAAYTDGGGMATVHIDNPPGEAMTLTLTVCAYNHIPVIEPVEVLPPSGPFVVFAGSSVDDQEGGNGDLDCDAGEIVDLFVTLENIGTSPATNVTAVLSAGDDPYVEIQIDTLPFGDINPGGEAISQGGYRIRFTGDAPDGYSIPFTLAVHCDQGDWDRSFSCPVAAAVLAYQSHLVDDTIPGGNSSGWIDAGELVNVALRLGNTGHSTATNVVATLMPMNPLVQIVDGTGEAAILEAGGEAVLTPFQIRILPECPQPTILTLRATVEADYGYTTGLQFTISVGGFADDFEAPHGWTIGAPGDNATSGIWVQADPVGTTYNGQIAQPEDDHTLTPGTVCFVTGNGSVGGAAGEADVDGGKTTLLSPVFDLSHVESATVQYWLYFTNHLGNNPSQDYWDVEATSNGVDWVPLEHTLTHTNGWEQRTFVLEQFVGLTSQVQLRFVASDTGAGSLVEALVDDFVLIATTPVMDAPAAEASLSYAIRNVSPNPAPGSTEIRFEVPVEGRVSLRVYDVQGRLVRGLHDGQVAAGVHQLQ
ncbi:MAG: C25 family cysteine peptidase, partial [Candidatus Eisenbacteria bacterium]|nr:C25 family cysteine peptidase [Candidatus Eisenbacteria bacterium]